MTLEEAKKDFVWSTLSAEQQSFLEWLWKLKGDADEAIRRAYNTQAKMLGPYLQSLKRSPRVRYFWQHMGLRDVSREEMIWLFQEILDKAKTANMKYLCLKAICNLKGFPITGGSDSVKGEPMKWPGIAPGRGPNGHAENLEEFKE